MAIQLRVASSIFNPGESVALTVALSCEIRNSIDACDPCAISFPRRIFRSFLIRMVCLYLKVVSQSGMGGARLLPRLILKSPPAVAVTEAMTRRSNGHLNRLYMTLRVCNDSSVSSNECFAVPAKIRQIKIIRNREFDVELLACLTITILCLAAVARRRAENQL